jgi:hypothetical protein
MVHGVLHCADTRTRRSGRAIDALKRMKIGVVPRGTVKVIFVLSAAMFHVERLLRML